jgi:hypothetical protein
MYKKQIDNESETAQENLIERQIAIVCQIDTIYMIIKKKDFW